MNLNINNAVKRINEGKRCYLHALMPLMDVGDMREEHKRQFA